MECIYFWFAAILCSNEFLGLHICMLRTGELILYIEDILRASGGLILQEQKMLEFLLANSIILSLIRIRMSLTLPTPRCQ